MKKVLLLWLVGVALWGAATIREIKFVGLVHISESVAKEYLDFKVGDTINEEKLDRAIKKFYQQGYFEDISVSVDGGAVTYTFKEKPSIAAIELIGYDTNKHEEMLGLLPIKKGDIYDKNAVDKAAKVIIRALEKKGFFDSIAEPQITEVGPLAVKVDFVVNEGEKLIIDSVELFGNRELEYSDFKDYISNRERQFMGWMWGRDDGELKAEDLKNDPARIRDYYMRKGYMDAKVSTPFLRAYYDGYTAKLSYRIFEGRQYMIESVAVDAPAGIVDEGFEEELLSESDRIFNVERVRKDVAKLTAHVGDKGYAYVQVIPDVQQDSQNYKTKIIYKVNPGNKVTIRDIKISGNSKTIDKIIRRELYVTEGDLYHFTDLKESKHALARTGYFQNITIDKTRVDDTTIDLLVKVEEAPTGSILGGVGYSTSDGFLLNAGLNDKNLMGSGIEVGVDVDFSEKELAGRIYFQNPRIFDSVYSFGGSAYSSKYEFYDYDEDRLGMNFTVGRKLGKHFSTAVTYTLEETELSEFSETINQDLYRTGPQLKSSIRPAITFNNTDDYFLPRSGMIFSSSVEYAGLGGDEEFVRSITKLNLYKGLEETMDYDLILRYKGQFGYAYDNGYLPINEKFYIGGVSTVRGYKSKSISPQNEAGDLLGGTTMFVSSVEASIPLIESLQMRLAFFVDYGMIGEDGLDINRGGTGAAFEWISPLGAINLIFAQPLSKEPGDRTSEFEFTMGKRF